MNSRIYPALLFLALTASACSVYDSNLVEKGLAGVPARPPMGTTSDGDDVEAVFALHNVSLDQSGDRWRRFGLDLDGMNTASVADAAECVGSSGRPPLDGDKGIDNAFGQYVLPTVMSLIPCLEDNIALIQGTGRGTGLIRLRHWNGTPNDAKVDVSTFVSVDGTSLDDISELEWSGPDGSDLVLPDSVDDAPDPSWDGQDYFFVDPSTLIGGDLDRPVIWKSDAYIADGRIVLPLDTDSTLVLPTGPGTFSITLKGFLVADLSEDGQSLEKGLIAGRFPAGKLVSALEPIGICNDTLQESVIGLITDHLDLRADEGAGDAEDECTAIGVALTFQGARARIADLVAPVELPTRQPCAGQQSGLDPAFDRCCRSVELNWPEQLPEECTAEDLQPFVDLPNPIPVPPQDGF